MGISLLERVVPIVPLPLLPASNQSGGPVTITITVDDGPDPDVTSTFVFTINPVNDLPVITALGPQSVNGRCYASDQ